LPFSESATSQARSRSTDLRFEGGITPPAFEAPSPDAVIACDGAWLVGELQPERQGNSMNTQRRTALIAGAGFIALGMAGCTTTSDTGGDPAARRQAIDSAADSVLSRLYAQQPGTKELVASARGVLVFPSFVSAGFVFGAGSGQGVLRAGGKSTGYFRMTEASAGLLAGAQSQAVFILFMTEQALKRFESSNGWTAGADASITMINVGANAQVTTQTARQEVIGFVMSNAGLMGNVSLNGNRITRLDI
jgi:lipid-binding SYLF domain-containing protein